jgi:hypothetical protein
VTFDRGEIVVVLSEVEGTNLCGTYWPDAAVKRMLGQGFEILVHFDPLADPADASNMHLEHDAYLLRRL